MPRPFEAYRARRLRDIEARYDAFLSGGFPVVGGETLQCRNDVDRSNWLGLKDSCDDAVVAGLGDELLQEPGIRCTSNRFVRPTYAECLTIMRELRAWYGAAQANLWRLKDAVDRATGDRPSDVIRALNDIDLEAGWP